MSQITFSDVLTANKILSLIRPQPDEKEVLCLKLRSNLLGQYIGKYKDLNRKILIQSPINGAMVYNFISLSKCLRFLGITAIAVESTSLKFDDRNPDLFLTCSANSFAQHLDFELLKKHKERGMIIGVLLDNEQNEDIMKLMDFPITMNYEIIKTLDGFLYDLYFSPLAFYNMSILKQYDYFHAGQASFNKAARLNEYMTPIINKYNGVLMGSGLPNSIGNALQEDTNIFYNMARVNLNLHMNAQIKEAIEINERAYIINATGNLQLVDNPALLFKKYNRSLLTPFCCKDSKDYIEMFEYYLDDKHRETVDDKIMELMKITWKKYTMFHLIDNLINFLEGKWR